MCLYKQALLVFVDSVSWWSFHLAHPHVIWDDQLEWSVTSVLHWVLLSFQKVAKGTAGAGQIRTDTELGSLGEEPGKSSAYGVDKQMGCSAKAWAY